MNLVPSPNDVQVKLLRPVRFSIRDAETYINPASIRVKAGYAKVFSDAKAPFDTLARTKRVALASGIASEPVLGITDDGVTIQRTTSAPQRSVYATSIDGGIGYNSVMVSALVRPDTLTPFDSDADATPLEYAVYPGPIMPLPFSPVVSVTSISDNGTVLGFEHGPRNKAVYFRLQLHSDGTRVIRLTSYAFPDGSSPIINSTVVFDWSTFRRYVLIWNEAEGLLELYGQISTATYRLYSLNISDIPDMPAGYFIQAGAPGDVTVLYGQLGPSGDQSTWANIAITTDVGYPILGNVLPGDFVTTLRGAELIQVTGAKDPRDRDISSWVVTDEDVIDNLDDEATTFIDNGKFEIFKPTQGKTYSFYREEPALLSSSSEGFMVQARIDADNSRLDSAATGMGITIYDGQSVFQLQLFDDLGVKTIGILKKDGIDDDITEYYLPLTAFDWSGGHLFRFVVDPRRATMRLYDGDDMSAAILDLSLDRSTIPNGTDFGWDGLVPFIVFGHTMAMETVGTFILYSLEATHLYQAWDAEDTGAPTAANPPFTEAATGGASSAMTGGALVITAPTDGLDKFSRAAPFGLNRGAVLEASLQVTSWRKLSRTGLYLILDDGTRAFVMTFLENNLGKFVALSFRNGLGGFTETVGRDGPAAMSSFLFDWSQPHTYRLERRPFDGVKIYVDNETDPRIAYPESGIALLPDILFSGTPTIAFGQFSGEGSVSSWNFVRGMFSRGYEVSFKKNQPDNVLRSELIGTQAIIVADATDTD